MTVYGSSSHDIIPPPPTTTTRTTTTPPPSTSSSAYSRKYERDNINTGNKCKWNKPKGLVPIVENEKHVHETQQ